MEKNKEDLLAMLIEAVNDSIINMVYNYTDCGVEYYPEFGFEPNITFTDEDVEAIREMANGGDENAESLLDLFEECKSRMDFEI